MIIWIWNMSQQVSMGGFAKAGFSTELRRPSLAIWNSVDNGESASWGILALGACFDVDNARLKA